MRIALHNGDKNKFPNLALLKIAAWHKHKGNLVEHFNPLAKYDIIYSSKVFTYKPDDPYLPDNAYKGGSGYQLKTALPEHIEHICPDYDFAGINYSLGFLTRGCSRNCSWCIVPYKEGTIRPHADITEFTRHQNVVLMDNNVLAHRHGIEQIEKIARLGLKVDFNQGLDARLIDKQVARCLAALKWIRFLRFSCDDVSQIPVIQKAVDLLRRAGGSYREYFCYVLVKSIPDAVARVEFLRAIKVAPFAQPFRNPQTLEEPAKELKQFARWVNCKAIFHSTPWHKYIPTYKERKQSLETA